MEEPKGKTAAEVLAGSHGYAGAEFMTGWDGAEVWNATVPHADGMPTGFPVFIIVDGAGARFADLTEMRPIMEYLASPSDFESGLRQTS